MERMANQKGLSLIKVDRCQLLEALRTNKEAHIADYNEAMEGFQVQRVKDLEKYLQRAQDGGTVPNHITFDEPTSHENEYTTVIEMLEFSVDDEVFVTMDEFKKYVRDEWSWSLSFDATNLKYK